MQVEPLLTAVDAGKGAESPTAADLAAAEVRAAELRPELDEATQRNRREEITTRIADTHRQAGRVIVETEVLEDGTVVDWVDRSTVAGANVAPPAPLKPSPLPRGVTRGTIQPLSGPPGTVPYIRPTFEPYVKGQAVGIDLDDYISRLPPGHPSELPSPNNNRLYVSNSTTLLNFGANAVFNTNWSGIGVPTGNDFAIAEIAVFCPTPTGLDLVGPILGRIPAIYSGGAVFGLERWIGGPAGAQWVLPTQLNGFVQVSTTLAPGITTSPLSAVGGFQTEFQMGVYFYAAVGSTPAGWWISLNSTFVGYFPASLFTSGAVGATLRTNACTANFYGENKDASSSTTSWMNADMSSGKRPPASVQSTNVGQAGWIRLPIIVTATDNGFGQFPVANSAALFINHRYCYDGRWTTDGGSVWNPTLWLGGPGGNGAGCNADPAGSFAPRNGAYVCSPGCTTCTGPGCGPAGGGRLCCGYQIDNAGTDCMTSFAPCKIKTADPECRTGLLNGGGTHCCGPTCTQCGGSGCNSGAGCCTGTIQNLCSGSMPPCKIDPPPAVP